MSPFGDWLKRLLGSDHHPTVREQYRTIGDDVETRAVAQFDDWGVVLEEVHRVEQLSTPHARRHRSAPQNSGQRT